MNGCRSSPIPPTTNATIASVSLLSSSSDDSLVVAAVSSAPSALASSASAPPCSSPVAAVSVNTGAKGRCAAYDRGDTAPAIADFVRGYSLEATRPTAEEVAALASAAAPGTRVYVSAVAARPPQEVIDSAVRLRAGGFNPVPHLAVRNFPSASAFDELLSRARGEDTPVTLIELDTVGTIPET